MKEKVTLFGTDFDEDKYKFRGHGLSWGVFLVGLGILLLLNTTGQLPFEIWGEIWRLWPLILISVGIKVILGENLISELLVSALLVFLFATLFVNLLGSINHPAVSGVPYELKNVSSFWEVIRNERN